MSKYIKLLLALTVFSLTTINTTADAYWRGRGYGWRGGYAGAGLGLGLGLGLAGAYGGYPYYRGYPYGRPYGGYPYYGGPYVGPVCAGGYPCRGALIP